MLVLSASEVDVVAAELSVDVLIELMTQVFKKVSSSPDNVQSPPRLSLNLKQHTTLIMPARVEALGTALKVVSVPKRGSGIPASTMVLDESTGAVRALVNAGNLTALRTAAGSALATRLLVCIEARPVRIVVFGAGAQIKAHLHLLLTMYPSMRECTVVNRTLNDRTMDIIVSFAVSHPDVAISALQSDSRVSVEHAVRTADIVVAATSSEVALFESEWIKRSAHVILVGSYKPTMREAPDELIHRAKVVVVDSREACKHEAGELISAGLRDEDMVELGELVNDPQKITTVRNAGDVTIFKSVGIAPQDVAIACAVVSRAEELGIGTNIGFD